MNEKAQPNLALPVGDRGWNSRKRADLGQFGGVELPLPGGVFVSRWPSFPRIIILGCQIILGEHES
jgi:hypothetical protein